MVDADALLARAARLQEALLPPGAVLGDAHTHLGLDEDGRSLTPEQHLASMAEAGIGRALVFPLNDPERRPAYRVPNDRVLDWAAASDGRLVPLARLDLADDPLGEARRAIGRGARGIKLHPRAQAFTVDDDRLEPVFALAEEHRLPVLIHAGRGMPPIAGHLAAVAERHPGAILILAHGAIVDQDRIVDLVAGAPNVFFDTSTFNVIDLLALFSRVPPEQILWASDVPYGTQRTSLFVVAALLEELDVPEPVRRGILGETLEDIIRGRLPERLGEPVAPRSLTFDAPRLRLGGYLAACLPFLFTGQRDVVGLAGLAHGVCDDAEGELAPLADYIAAALALWEASLEPADEGEQMRAISLLQIALTLTYLPRALRRLPAAA